MFQTANTQNTHTHTLNAINQSNCLITKTLDSWLLIADFRQFYTLSEQEYVKNQHRIRSYCKQCSYSSACTAVPIRAIAANGRFWCLFLWTVGHAASSSLALEIPSTEKVWLRIMFVCAAQNRPRGRAQPTGWKTVTILPSVSGVLFFVLFFTHVHFVWECPQHSRLVEKWVPAIPRKH